MIADNIRVKFEEFDGPLALLLQLIKRNEMDIKSLDINIITKEYLDFLQKINDLDFNLAGDYLFLAASLLYIKSENCFNESSDVKDLLNEFEKPLLSKEQLINRLENLERFQKIAKVFWGSLQKRGEDIFTRPAWNKASVINSLLLPMEKDDLINIMLDLIRRNNKKYTVVKRDRLSIKEKLSYLKEVLTTGEKKIFTELLTDLAKTSRELKLKYLEEINKKLDGEINSEINVVNDFPEETNIDKEKLKEVREETVITFISLLELARLKKIQLFQNQNYGEIYIDVIEDLNSFDVETANGFESEEDLAALEAKEQEEKEKEMFDQLNLHVVSEQTEQTIQ